MGKNEQTISTLRKYIDHKEKVPSMLHDQFLSLLREYMVVGGMPEVVNRFLESNNSTCQMQGGYHRRNERRSLGIRLRKGRYALETKTIAAWGNL